MRERLRVAAGAVVVALLAMPVCGAGSEAVPHNLVDVRAVYPPLLQEIRYATACNFTGYTLYPFPAAYVHADLVPALQKVQEELAAEGLGLKIYDGYRPLSVQAKMWEILPDERYVSDPTKSKGRHPRGVAVDVTLVDRLGNELRMPTAYDAFSLKAHRNSPNWSDEERRNSQKLEAVMTKNGFLPFAFEWWHYDFRGWEKYPVWNITFNELESGVKTAVPVP